MMSSQYSAATTAGRPQHLVTHTPCSSLATPSQHHLFTNPPPASTYSPLTLPRVFHRHQQLYQQYFMLPPEHLSTATTSSVIGTPPADPRLLSTLRHPSMLWSSSPLTAAAGDEVCTCEVPDVVMTLSSSPCPPPHPGHHAAINSGSPPPNFSFNNNTTATPLLLTHINGGE